MFEAATSVYPGYPRRIEVTGTLGTAILEGDTLVSVDLRGAPTGRAKDATPTVSESTPVVADASAHQRIIEDFIAAFETNRAPACDAREGRKSVAIVEAIYRSARDGGTTYVLR